MKIGLMSTVMKPILLLTQELPCERVIREIWVLS